MRICNNRKLRLSDENCGNPIRKIRPHDVSVIVITIIVYFLKNSALANNKPTCPTPLDCCQVLRLVKIKPVGANRNQ